MQENFFNTTYPIVEAGMNQVSDINLATAVSQAGAFPSLFLPLNQFEKSQQTIAKFILTANHKNVVVPISITQFSNKQILKLLHNFSPSHIEVLPTDDHGNTTDPMVHLKNPLMHSALKLLKKNSKIILRIANPFYDTDLLEHIDGFYIKGKESAGKTGSWSVKELFLEQKKITPNKAVIPYGGIGFPDQVSWYMSNGAGAVGVGTLFAACQESNLSVQAKQKMLKASSKDLTVLTDTQQNCLILGQVSEKTDDWNRTDNLVKAIKGDGTQGHLYVGHSIDAVDQIRTVDETVKYLCSCL